MESDRALPRIFSTQTRSRDSVRARRLVRRRLTFDSPPGDRRGPGGGGRPRETRLGSPFLASGVARALPRGGMSIESSVFTQRSGGNVEDPNAECVANTTLYSGSLGSGVDEERS